MQGCKFVTLKTSTCGFGSDCKVQRLPTSAGPSLGLATFIKPSRVLFILNLPHWLASITFVCLVSDIPIIFYVFLLFRIFQPSLLKTVFLSPLIPFWSFSYAFALHLNFTSTHIPIAFVFCQGFPHISLSLFQTLSGMVSPTPSEVIFKLLSMMSLTNRIVSLMVRSTESFMFVKHILTSGILCLIKHILYLLPCLFQREEGL